MGSAGGRTKSRHTARGTEGREGKLGSGSPQAPRWVGKQKSILSFSGHSVFATAREMMLSYTDASVGSGAAAPMLPKPQKHLALAV